jgi:tRNA (guanine-N7-)-methyltransferase
VTAGPDAPGSFFGRRKGKTLRDAQADRIATLLPGLRLPADGPVDPAALFPERPDAVHLEIGFGGGEHLAQRAAEQPGTGFVGVEPFVNGVAKCLAAVDEGALRNVRLWDDDAAALLLRLAPASVDRAYVLYPDPWPKRRQRKRRFLSDANLAALARVIRPGGELRFASAIDDSVGWVLARVARSPDFRWTARSADAWRVPWDGWRSTRYEAKAIREGRVPSYLTVERL